MQRLILLLFVIIIASPANAEQEDAKGKTQNVKVVNLPKTQNVDGAVAIKGLIRHSFLDRREQVLIPPVQRDDTNNLIEVGSIQADGFTSVILSLQGEVKSTTFTPGTVGAILVPDEKPIIYAFTQDRTILFPLEVKTEVKPGKYRYFTSETTSQVVGFPKYRVFLYNSTDKSVEVNLYVYLTN